MQLIDPNHSFYRPLWIRAAIVIVCLGWASIEATTGEPFWAIMVGALGIYTAWVLLLNFNPQPPPLVSPETDGDAATPAADAEKRDGEA